MRLMRTGAVTGRAQDSQSGPPHPRPPPDEGEAGEPTTHRLAQGRRLGAAAAAPLLWLPEARGRVWLICSSRAPSPGGGGEAPGAWGQAQSEGAPGGDPVSPCSWDGWPAAAAFPEMVVGGSGPTPSVPAAFRVRVSARDAGVHVWVVSSSARPGWARQSWESRMLHGAERESPALAGPSGGGRVLPPRVPDVHRAGAGT